MVGKNFFKVMTMKNKNTQIFWQPGTLTEVWVQEHEPQGQANQFKGQFYNVQVR